MQAIKPGRTILEAGALLRTSPEEFAG